MTWTFWFPAVHNVTPPVSPPPKDVDEGEAVLLEVAVELRLDGLHVCQAEEGGREVTVVATATLHQQPGGRRYIAASSQAATCRR